MNDNINTATIINGRGGARPGSGRPTVAAMMGLDEPVWRVTVRLPESLIEKIVRIGQGDKSVGLRACIEAYEEA